jgi:hypothetical protein
MSPPRVLPPGHFVGDGHNHGAESGSDVHNHGHDHAHESPEQHLHHMQEHQQARGRATLEEFHQAARETAQLTSGQRPESSPGPQARGEARPQPRENAGPRTQASEARQASTGAENRGQNAETARPATRDFSGLARMFSATAFAAPPANTSAWAEASRQQLRQPRSNPEQAPSNRRPGSEAPTPRSALTEGREAGTTKSAKTGAMAESQVLSQALAKLQVILQDSALRGTSLEKLPPEAAEALAVLLQEVVASPELLASLPPSLRSMVQNLMGPSGTLLPQIFSKLTAAGFAEVLQALLGRMNPGNLGITKAAAEVPLRGLGIFLGAPLFAAPGTAKFSPGLLQRLEKALLQFLQLLNAKPGAKPAKEAPLLDKALLEQLAALIAAEEKRRKEKERARKKDEASPALRAKRDSDFTEEGSEPEDSEELLMNVYG